MNVQNNALYFNAAEYLGTLSILYLQRYRGTTAKAPRVMGTRTFNTCATELVSRFFYDNGDSFDAALVSSASSREVFITHEVAERTVLATSISIETADFRVRGSIGFLNCKGEGF